MLSRVAVLDLMVPTDRLLCCYSFVLTATHFIPQLIPKASTALKFIILRSSVRITKMCWGIQVFTGRFTISLSVHPLKLIVLEVYYRIIFFPLNSSLGYWSPYTDQI